MAINRELSVDIICEITRQLNNQILEHGELQKNNMFIWKQILHKMSNEVWEGALTVLLEVCEYYPQMAQWNDKPYLETALRTVDKYSAYYDNVLDMSNKHLHHKAIAWRSLMIMREIVTKVWGIDLPNHNTSKRTNQFQNIFE